MEDRAGELESAGYLGRGVIPDTVDDHAARTGRFDFLGCGCGIEQSRRARGWIRGHVAIVPDFDELLVMKAWDVSIYQIKDC